MGGEKVFSYLHHHWMMMIPCVQLSIKHHHHQQIWKNEQKLFQFISFFQNDNHYSEYIHLYNEPFFWFH